MNARKSLKPERYIGPKPFLQIATPAEIIAHKHDEPDVDDWRFRQPILSSLPNRYAIPVANRYNNIYAEHGRRDANLYLLDTLDTKEDLTDFALDVSGSYDDLIFKAVSIANGCSRQRLLLRNTNSQITLDRLIIYIYNCYGIDLSDKFKSIPVTATDPNVTGTVTVKEKIKPQRNVTLSIEGILNRLCDELWWRRTLRNITIRNVEKYAIDLGLVHKNAGIYISDESLHRRQQQKRRNKRKLEQCLLVNELGQEYTLQELAETSLANPSNRRAELMVRIRGTEEISKSLGHKGMFYTMTCPSRMHARRSKSGQANPKHDGTTPVEAHQYLAKLWTQIRAKLKRMGIDYYGFRVVEPHHDGTPHWHLLLFMEKGSTKSVTSVLREYTMREDGNEAGAEKHRFTAIKVDPKKGSATGYIAKYISKSIDGYGLDDDLYGKDAASSSERISTWSSVWGIRQFQQLGGPPVTIYRELRRIQGRELKGALLEAWEAADQGDWETFIKLMGGPNVKRKDHPIKLMRDWSDEPNRYKEPKGYKISGLECGNISIPTRIHQWTVKYQPEPLIKVFSIENNLNPIMGPPMSPLNWQERFFEKISPHAA